ncbi:MAG: UDP-N-acetylmuramoyl-tripeptide--D-alanyl-D-alanine ligase [Candidatus Riflebacteria bacterium]|nr:UDP-N-acetylmuramoyl-tripeptide--D-alanyl-D-alanine ligase [Candidatus Riflebacteria bacterium]
MKSERNIASIASVCRGKVFGAGEKQVSGFSIDSRSIKPGELYVALKGENHDGHSFVAAAVKSGAEAVLVSEMPDAETCLKTTVILVDDTLNALQAIAAGRRNELDSFFVGITGSNGKTTTRSMVYHIMSEKWRCSTTTGNLNNHIGLPLTILAISNDSQYSILEMGMNHSGEIRDLCRIARPQAALISNIGPAHIGILGNLENIARAKAEILEHLDEGQTAIVPGDSEFTEIFRKAAGKARLMTFGEKAGNNYRLTDLNMQPDSVSFTLVTPAGSKTCHLALAGRHNAFNAAAALSLCHQLGCDLDLAVKRLVSFCPVGARMEKVCIDGLTVLLDCYNANPGSMQEALRYLAICGSPRVAVLGDMRELGEMSVALHRQLGTQAAEARPDLLVCVGSDAANIATAAIDEGMPEDCVISLNSGDLAAELLKERLQKGSTVLFKASRGMHFEKIVQKLWPGLGKDLH